MGIAIERHDAHQRPGVFLQLCGLDERRIIRLADDQLGALIRIQRQVAVDRLTIVDPPVSRSAK